MSQSVIFYDHKKMTSSFVDCVEGLEEPHACFGFGCDPIDPYPDCFEPLTLHGPGTGIESLTLPGGQFDPSDDESEGGKEDDAPLQLKCSEWVLQDDPSIADEPETFGNFDDLDNERIVDGSDALCQPVPEEEKPVRQETSVGFPEVVCDGPCPNLDPDCFPDVHSMDDENYLPDFS